MSDPDPTATKNSHRWAMSLEELTKSIANGMPGSDDWEHGLAVLQAKGILAATKSAKETASLRRATWVMAVATFTVAMVAGLVALFG